MTKTRTGGPFMPAGDYGRAMPQFSVNLLVKNVETSVTFYRDVAGVNIRYADGDFAALELNGWQFMLHADHTYDHHPSYVRLQDPRLRGTGAELRFLGVDPDATERRAKMQEHLSYSRLKIIGRDGATSCWLIRMDIPRRWVGQSFLGGSPYWHCRAGRDIISCLTNEAAIAICQRRTE